MNVVLTNFGLQCAVVIFSDLVMATLRYFNTFIDEEPIGNLLESCSKSWPQFGGTGHWVSALSVRFHYGSIPRRFGSTTFRFGFWDETEIET